MPWQYVPTEAEDENAYQKYRDIRHYVRRQHRVALGGLGLRVFRQRVFPEEEAVLSTLQVPSGSIGNAMSGREAKENKRKAL